jgi:putative NADPH-quinone reductase
MSRAPKRIVILQGHPDGSPARFLRALARAYLDAARAEGHEVRIINLASLEFPLLKTSKDWLSGKPVQCIRAAQELIGWANHIVLFYPLWMGDMPALVKAFLEQVLRPGFAMRIEKDGRWRTLLGGRSARIVVTMGMPASVYRWYFAAHSLKSLERNTLGFCGVAPIRHTLIGNAEGCGVVKRALHLRKLQALGRRGD